MMALQKQWGGSLLLIIAAMGSLAFDASATTGTLVYVDDLAPFNVNWYTPQLMAVSTNPSPGMTLPTFVGDVQLFGSIWLGNSTNGEFAVAADLLGTETNVYGAYLYFDRNQDRNLTNDGGPWDMRGVEPAKLPTFQVPCEDGPGMPYSLGLYDSYWQGEYGLWYYRDCGWTGTVALGTSTGRVLVLALDDLANGLYNDDGWDSVVVDADQDGILDGSTQSSNVVHLYSQFLVGDGAFRVGWISPDGSRIRVDGLGWGAMTGRLTCALTTNQMADGSVWGRRSIRLDSVANSNGEYRLPLPEGEWWLTAAMPGCIPTETSLVIEVGVTNAWSPRLRTIPVPQAGIVRLVDSDCFDFAQGVTNWWVDHDICYYNQSFGTYYDVHRGCVDLGDIGDVSLRSVALPPEDWYDEWQWASLEGHTYVVRGRIGTEGGYGIFRVLTQEVAAVVIEYYYVNPADVDRNDLWDVWETEIFGSTGQDAEKDEDEDGASNRAEMLAGTHPTNKASAFLISPSYIVASNTVVLTWPSSDARTYDVLSATNITRGFSVDKEGLAATPPVNTYTSAWSSGATRYFKVRLGQ